MQKDTEKLVQNTSWEKEFDRAFASPSWSPAPMKKIFDELMQDGVKPFIRKTLAQREKEIAEEVKKKRKEPTHSGTGSISWYNQALDEVLLIIKK